MQLKMDAMASGVQHNDSSIKSDFSFFKEHLDMIKASVFTTGSQHELEEDSSDSEDKDQPLTAGRTVAGKTDQKVKVSEASGATPMEEEPYSKIKEKKKHKNAKKNKKTKVKNDARLANVITPRQEELREKLRARIEELKGKRQLSIDEKREKMKLKRKESLISSKLRKKAEKQNKNKGNIAKKETQVNGEPGSPKAKLKPVYNKEGKLVFSKFDFTETGGKDRGKSNLVGKDYKRLLEKIEKRQQHIDKVKETDMEKGKQVETKMAWEAAIQRSQGQKVKDDPALLKRAMKQKEKGKKQKQKQWKQRDEQTKQRMDAKNDKRTRNIEERKQQKKDNKIKKSKKKGRLIAGF